jgi:hypothetical protein
MDERLVMLRHIPSGILAGRDICYIFTTNSVSPWEGDAYFCIADVTTDFGVALAI